MLTRRFQFVLFGLLLTLSPAVGKEPVFKFSEVNSHKKLIKQAEADSAKQFEKWVASYQTFLDEHPDDVVAATEMCRFIRHHNYSDAVYHKQSEEYLEQAEQHLRDSFTDNPISELYFLDQLYGDELLKKAATLVKSKTIEWSKAQLASIYLEVAIYHRRNGDQQQAGENALKSLELNPSTTAQLIAGDYLKTKQLHKRGIEILTSEYPKEFPNQKKKRMLLLSQFGAHNKALEILEQLRKLNPKTVTPVEETEVWIRNNSITKARQVFVSNQWSYWDTNRLAKAYFNFEKEHGNSIQTLNAYNFLRDQGYTKDPLLYHRFCLAIKHPYLPWGNRDWMGVLTLVGILMAALCIPLLFLIPVHYWGLIRQQAGKGGEGWLPKWTLRDAWRASAFFLFISSFLISYLFAYEEVFPPMFDETAVNNSPASSLQLAWMVLAGDIVMLLGLAWVVGLKSIWQAYLPARWSVQKALLFALLGFFCIKIFAFSIDKSWAANEAEASFTVQSLQAVLDTYGPAVLILAVAILTPVIEEILFRGVLLTALTKHIPFWAANVLQSALFMVAHEEARHFPFYFIFGLVCGVFRQRSGNLVACTMLHCINNAVAAFYLMGLANL